MFRVLIAIVLMVGSTALLLPSNADATAVTMVEEIDPPVTDEIVIGSVEVRRSPTVSTMPARDAGGVGPSSGGGARVFRPPRG